jgi:hypothetical protein
MIGDSTYKYSGNIYIQKRCKKQQGLIFDHWINNIQYLCVRKLSQSLLKLDPQNLGTFQKNME